LVLDKIVVMKEKDGAMEMTQHVKWMKEALLEAEKAMDHGEIPVASILVAGDKELCRGQTQVVRRGSIAAHGELFTLLEAKSAVFTADRPIALYTTLEPCLMCLGAAIQTGIDLLVYGMDAAPDGGTSLRDAIVNSGQSAPKIVPHILESEQVSLMKQFVIRHPNSPAIPYVQALLKKYS
jgi:tRNA(adenine34) deaminase